MTLNTDPLPLRRSRYATLLWIGAVFLIVNLLVRIGLLAFEGDWSNLRPLRLFGIFGVGLIFDLAGLAYVLAPIGLLAAAVSNRAWGRKLFRAAIGILGLTLLFGALFTAVAEFVFWNEFSTRFNFIAVDYLVYTREVLGNIRQSYPIGWILLALGATSAGLLFAASKRFLGAAAQDAGSGRRRLAVAVISLALPFLSFFAIGPLGVALSERLGSASARALAGDGYFEIFHAFRANDLDFASFYRMLPERRARRVMREEFAEAGTTSKFERAANPMTRDVVGVGEEKRWNVVLVSIESLGSDYVESFGGRPGLTPNLDALSREGLMFTNLYATGLRTVRGLEALTLSIPPTPGHAVPMRAHNKGFLTLGKVFAEKGYESLYLYGGYSYFDNMKDFFSGNGYTVIDRTAIPDSEIHHETVWGVADEDLYRLAIREIDQRVAAGRPVFAHVMTTSNHRPYTYPDGRVSIPSGTGREGAVAYTDWAIGNFVREAKTRPWFTNTLFVFVADHTSHGRGRTDLPPENYRIPLVIYAPSHLAPSRIETIASQIDVGPTVLALLGWSYSSTFFGQDILTEGTKHQRAFFANYLTVGYMEHGLVVELSPLRKARVLDAKTGVVQSPDLPISRYLVDEAIAHYEVASEILDTKAVPD